MEFYDVIMKRYSVRSYQDEPVDKEKLDRVLDVARQAPTGRNRQEWKIVIVSDVETRRRLANASGQTFLEKAPVVLAIVGLTPNQVMHCQVPADPVDCAIVLDHISLAAAAEGLGTCWIGHFDQRACCEILQIPPSAKIIEMMTLGRPADKPAQGLPAGSGAK